MKGKLLYLLFSAVIIAVITFFMFHYTSVNSFRYLHISRPDQQQLSQKLILVGLDDKSSEMLNTPLVPPRRMIAAAIDNLTELGVKVIAIDMMFNGAKEDDSFLVESLKRSSRVVIGGQIDDLSNRIELVNSKGRIDQKNDRKYFTTIKKDIAASAAGIGAINSDSSDIFETYLPVVIDKSGQECAEQSPDQTGKTLITKLSIKVFEIAEKSRGKYSEDRSRFSIGKYSIPVCYDGGISVNYQATEPDRQKNYCSFFQVVSDDWKKALSREKFKDSIVLIFPASIGLADFIPCPYLADSTAGTMYGGMIHANLISQILENRYLYRLHPNFVQFCFFLFMMVFVLTVYHFRLWIGLILYFLISILYIVLSTILFSEYQVTGHNFLLFVILLFVSFFLGLGMKYLRNRQIKTVFSRFVGDSIMKELLKIKDESELLSGKRKELTVLLLDIRGFTRLSDEIPSEEVVKILNSFFDVASDIILLNGGTIDKYMGDSIMAFFGAPIGLEEKERKAVDCLYEIIEVTSLIKFEGRHLTIGGAVTTGEVVVGNIGCSRKMEYTIIGTAVNLASRIEALNKKYGTSILMDKTTAERCMRKEALVSVGIEDIRGISEKVELFTIAVGALKNE